MATGMLIQFPGGTQDFYDSVMTNLDWDSQPPQAQPRFVQIVREEHA